MNIRLGHIYRSQDRIPVRCTVGKMLLCSERMKAPCDFYSGHLVLWGKKYDLIFIAVEIRGKTCIVVHDFTLVA